ncbi:LamG-like jellyroll fold domain-containing protein [Streptomyces gardneri]|uniref:LamG-like jellyroll fold domain-containing protein n=1 Tax=Streptomyces gardneri TaxID=66892 RepID=UPI0035DDB03B
MALLATASPAASGGTAAANEQPVVALTESERALKEAAESGSRVEVVGERSERDTVFANPDGATFTLESSIVPVRVDTGSGWAVPDATLERRTDGSIGPKASTVDVDFSAGGLGQDLVTVGQDGQSVSMGWPGQLPEPRLDGPRATYEDVLPDVNLILTATVEGFQQVLEVETPAAAALPELKQIEYALSADGLRLREGEFGSMEALDGNGQVVFRSPTARMWNSAGGDIATAASPAAGMQPQSAGLLALANSATDPQAEAPELVTPPEEGDPLGGPGAGDKSAVMEVELGQGSLTVIPDAALIAATDPDDFPLYIDPSVELDQTKRTVLSSDGDVFYDFANGENGMSVGKCGSAVINGVLYPCGNGYVNRMYFEFSPTALRGKHILDATFRVTETWSFSCDSRWVDLVRTDWISSASKWPGPTARDHMGDRDVSAGRGTACSPSQPRSVVEFHDNPAEPEENLTPTVRALANGTYNSLTLMLRAKDETDTISWKRFNNDGTLTATYMSKPAVPGEYGVLSGGTVPVCSKTEQGATMISDPTPSLLATPRAASGAEAQAMLRVYYDLDYKLPDGTWYDAPPPTTGSVEPTTGHVSYSSTAKDFPTRTKNWNATLKENTLYRYTAYTYSFKDTSYTDSLSSSGTSWCYFKVDTTAPKPPSVLFADPYSECVTGGSCVAAGGPGTTATVTFVGDSSVKEFQYKLSTDDDEEWSPWYAATNGRYTANITPELSGVIVLSVQGRDVLKRPGFTAVKFLVSEGAGPIGEWSFNETSGVAIDTSTSNAALRNNLTLTAAGAARNEHGRRGELTATDGEKSQDKALALTKASQGAASTTKPVIETRGSFTVTAWARLTSDASVATVLAQNGSVHSSFYLSYCTDLKVPTWCVRLPDSDTADSAFSGQRANAKNPPQFNAWTHLGVVVDTAQDRLSFYVNGVLQDSDILSASAWASSGGLQVGRAKYNNSYSEYFPGDIDEVVVWQQPLTPKGMQIEAGAKSSDLNYVELVADYNPSSGSGSTLQDSSGYGNTLSLSGASLNDGSLALDGVDDSASTARPLVDDTGSFTVSTAVDVDEKKLQTMENDSIVQVLGQQSTTGTSWGIWFEKTTDMPRIDNDNPILDENGKPIPEMVGAGRWHFGSPDGSGVSVQSDELIVPDGVARVTGVYDATLRTIRLYIGGYRQGVPRYYSAKLGSGFTVGKRRASGVWADFLPGKITDIRVWVGALSNEQHHLTVVGS